MLLLPMSQLPLLHPYLFNKYTQWYYNIINNARTRKLEKSTYVERHHIVPESFFINRTRKGIAGCIEGNPNDKSNIVHLQTCSGKPGCFSPWMDSCFSKKFVICIFNCVDTFINRCEVNT